MTTYSITKSRGWRLAKKLYMEAFGETGKPIWVIKNMFQKKLCRFHLLREGDTLVAFSIAGKIPETRLLLIDYFAVSKEYRQKGYGRILLENIKSWAENKYEGILIEVEADHPEIEAFWAANGFHSTTYVKKYKWVPEPYRAMYFDFGTGRLDEMQPERMFELIVQFHREAFKPLEK